MDTPNSPSSNRFSSFSYLRKHASRVLLICLFLVLVGVGAIPGYLSGNWLWSDLPQVKLQEIRRLRNTGLTLPKWETLEQAEVNIGSHKWSAQLLQNGQQRAAVYLLPQNTPQDQPQVEWMDIQGAEGWRSDSYGKLSFTVDETSKVKARFFRAWNRQQTFAVVQWYGWLRGGHFAPVQWFRVDQMAQLRQSRVPWVAICLKIPIEPLGDISVAKPLARSLAQEIQAALREPLQSSS